MAALLRLATTTVRVLALLAIPSTTTAATTVQALLLGATATALGLLASRSS